MFRVDLVDGHRGQAIGIVIEELHVAQRVDDVAGMPRPIQSGWMVVMLPLGLVYVLPA